MPNGFKGLTAGLGKTLRKQARRVREAEEERIQLQSQLEELQQQQAQFAPAIPTAPMPTPVETTAVSPTIPEAQAPSPLQQIMGWTPEQREAEFGRMRETGMAGIEDWWNRARREFERRGIAGGGLMGSQPAGQFRQLMAQRGRMEQELGRGIESARYAAGRQEPLTQLQALEDVRRWEAGQALAQQQPWIGVGQQIMGAPWQLAPQTTTMQQPGPGIIPGAIAGAGMGMNIYGMGQDYGWWGGGSSVSPTTSPFTMTAR